MRRRGDKRSGRGSQVSNVRTATAPIIRRKVRYDHLHAKVVLTSGSGLQEQIMAKIPIIPVTKQGPSHSDIHPDKNEMKAIEESKEQTVSRPGGFANDPDDPTNPNEALERYHRKLRERVRP
jgi:hypothetical protein